MFASLYVLELLRKVLCRSAFYRLTVYFNYEVACYQAS